MTASLLRILRPFIADFVARVTPLPPGRVTSWLRSDARNTAVGGVPYSQHLLALAVDVIPAGDREAFKAAARAQGLVVIDEGDHLHLQRFPAGVLDGFIAAARAAGLL